MRSSLVGVLLASMAFGACGGQSDRDGNAPGGSSRDEGGEGNGAGSPGERDDGSGGSFATGGGSSVDACGARFCFGRSHFAVGPGAKGLEVVDCDDDDVLDVVVANSEADTVSVLRGEGGGSFARQKTFLAGEDPWTLDSGDVNRDGHVDLLVGNAIDGSRVLFGDGSCGFEERVELFGGDPLGRGTHGGRAVALGDVTADGILDALVSMVSDGGMQGHVAVFEGVGDGTFLDVVTHPVSTSLGDLEVIDLDGDERPDVLALTDLLAFGTPRVHVLSGEPAGTLAEEVSFPALPRAGSLAVAHFDGNDRLDIASTSSSSVNLLLANDVSFDAPVTFSLGATARHLAAGDLDDDGHTDLVVTLGADNQVAVLAGDGAGGVAPPVRFDTGDYTTMYDRQEPNHIALADLDGDGDLDMVMTNYQGEITVLLNES